MNELLSPKQPPQDVTSPAPPTSRGTWYPSVAQPQLSGCLELQYKESGEPPDLNTYPRISSLILMRKVVFECLRVRRPGRDTYHHRGSGWQPSLYSMGTAPAAGQPGQGHNAQGVRVGASDVLSPLVS